MMFAFNIDLHIIRNIDKKITEYPGCLTQESEAILKRARRSQKHFGCRGDRSRCQIGGDIHLPAGTSKPLLIIADAAAREARN